jgi:hypothetical protein
MWGASSGFYEPPRNSHFFDNDIFSSGGNIFFPTSGGASSGISRRLADSKPSNRRKQYGSRVPIPNTSSTALDSDDEFQTIKKRLSLSSLRTSLCRQKALENLNNNNSNNNENGAAASSTSGANGASSGISGSNDDFLQVFIF